MSFRSLSRIVPVLAAAASLAALDNEQALSPFLIGGPEQLPPSVQIDSTLQSKVVDLGLAIYDDTVLDEVVAARWYGLGAKVGLDFAVGQAPDISRPGEKVSPAELVRSSLTLDWAVEIRDPRNPKAPLVQIIPRYRWVTYPNQRGGEANVLKEHQSWFGGELWYALPWEGIEIGGSMERNSTTNHWPAYHWEFGAREFIQTTAVDLNLWQKMDAGNAAYRNLICGQDNSGLNTIDIGAKATVPLFLREWFAFAQFDASYWLGTKERDTLSLAGQDNGNAVISIGLSWRPE